MRRYKFVLIFGLIWWSCPSFGQSDFDTGRQDSSYLTELEEVAEYFPGNSNPIKLIKVANDLMDLPKSQILDEIKAIQVSDAVRSGDFGLFLVLKLVFEIPDSVENIEVIWGIPNVPAPAFKDEGNKFPLLLVDGFPFLIPGGYILNGLPDSIERHLEFYQEFGTVRKLKFATDCFCSKDELILKFKAVWKKYYEEDPSTHQLNAYMNQIDSVVVLE